MKIYLEKKYKVAYGFKLICLQILVIQNLNTIHITAINKICSVHTNTLELSLIISLLLIFIGFINITVGLLSEVKYIGSNNY
jgi:hypothetical protein